MKTIQDIKQMMREPASKEWFAKHGSPKNHALHRVSHTPSYKKYEGKAQRNIEGESRADQIKRINHHSQMHGVITKARDRHERRHESKPGTSKHEALERAKMMSKD